MIRTHWLRAGWFLMLLAMAANRATAADDAVPPRSDGGQALRVPAEHLALGEAYHLTPGGDTQIMFHSDAPLLRYTAVCNRVVGYVIAPFDLEDDAPPILAGALRIPVASLRCGLERWDAELQAEDRLNAAAYPEITARLTSVRDVKLVSAEKNRRAYTATLTGAVTIKDKTTEISAPVQLLFAPFTWQTMNRNLGDVLILRTRVDLPAADLGFAPPPRPSPDFVPDTYSLDVFLLCSPVSPEKNLDPRVPDAQYRRQMYFLTLLRDFNDPEAAYTLGRSLMREIWDDAAALNRLAWAVLAEEGIERRSLAFVEEAAGRANELTHGEDAPTLMTLARLHYEREDLKAALSLVRQAAARVDSLPPYEAEPIRAALAQYEAEAARRAAADTPTSQPTTAPARP